MNLRYVTNGNLKLSRRNYDPESGMITLSLELADPEWQPRQGIKNWNETFVSF